MRISTPATHQSETPDPQHASISSVLTVELRDKAETITALKNALLKQKEDQKVLIEKLEEEFHNKIVFIKKDHDHVVDRNLKLIDRLIADKKDLTTKCETMVDEIKCIEKRFQIRLEQVEQSLKQELNRQKQCIAGNEKLRRDSWEKEKIKEIKELTIKGLEPEVERILQQCKSEKKLLEDQSNQRMEILQQELNSSRFNMQREVNEATARQIETLLQNERDHHRLKLKEEFNRFTAMLSDERTKHAEELVAAKSGHEKAIEIEVKKWSMKIESILEEEKMKALKIELQSKKEFGDLQRRHGMEISRCEKEKEEEKRVWQGQLETKLFTEAKLREDEYKKKLKDERDKKIQEIVDRLAEDSVVNEKEIKRRANEDIENLKNDFQNIRFEFQEKISCLEIALSACKDDNCRLASEVTRETEIKNEIMSELRSARFGNEKLQELVREGENEISELCKKHENEITALRNEIERNLAVFDEKEKNCDFQILQRQKAEELTLVEIETTVKETLERKESEITALRIELSFFKDKSGELEKLLDRQRSELLGDLLTLRPGGG